MTEEKVKKGKELLERPNKLKDRKVDGKEECASL